MNEYFERLKPKACFEYASAPKSVLSQVLKAAPALLDMNTDTLKYQQIVVISAPDEKLGHFIKDKKQTYWISTEQVTTIYSEWKEVFQNGYSVAKEWTRFYKEKVECNVVIIHIDVEVNTWVYCFTEPVMGSLDSSFIHKYLGEVLDTDATIQIIENLY